MEKITNKRKKQKKADGLGNPFTNPEEKMNIERENTDELKRRSFDILKITKVTAILRFSSRDLTSLLMCQNFYVR